MNNNIVICYTDTASGVRDYTSVADAEHWLNNNPSCRIEYIFKEKWDLLNRDTNLQADFIANCNRHGIPSNYLHKRFTDPKSHTVELRGYNPSNRKYKFIVYDENTGSTYKVSESYIRRCVLIP